MEAKPPVSLLDRVRDRIRLKHYSIRTEQAYCDWIRRFVVFHGKRHPSGLGAAEVEAFLTSLAVQGRVAASTQNQAKSALLFLYKEVLGTELPWLDNVERARAPTRLPVVLTSDEVSRVLARLEQYSVSHSETSLADDVRRPVQLVAEVGVGDGGQGPRPLTGGATP